MLAALLWGRAADWARLTLCLGGPQENETWWLCNCTMAVCKHDSTVELVEVECDPPPMPTCSNGLTPVRVKDPDGCCWHWECDCKPLPAGSLLCVCWGVGCSPQVGQAGSDG